MHYTIQRVSPIIHKTHILCDTPSFTHLYPQFEYGNTQILNLEQIKYFALAYSLKIPSIQGMR